MVRVLASSPDDWGGSEKNEANNRPPTMKTNSLFFIFYSLFYFSRMETFEKLVKTTYAALVTY
jgi:hypothetical protein